MRQRNKKGTYFSNLSWVRQGVCVRGNSLRAPPGRRPGRLRWRGGEGGHGGGNGGDDIGGGGALPWLAAKGEGHQGEAMVNARGTRGTYLPKVLKDGRCTEGKYMSQWVVFAPSGV